MVIIQDEDPLAFQGCRNIIPGSWFLVPGSWFLIMMFYSAACTMQSKHTRSLNSSSLLMREPSIEILLPIA